MTRTCDSRHGWLLAAFTVMAAVLMSPWTGPLLAQDASSGDKADAGEADTSMRATRQKLINQAMTQLRAEAEQIEKYKGTVDPKPVFSRPHALVSSWDTSMAEDVLRAIVRPITGNDYQDTYIRWHMMDVLLKCQSGELRDVSELIVQLIKQMPGPVEAERMREHYDEPPEIAAKYHQLINKASAVTGYPPYQKHVRPPASFKYHTNPEQARKWWEEAQKLRPQWKRIRDPEAIARNRRIEQVNWIVRQYRGELLYALFYTGDPAMARLVFREVDRQLASDNDYIAYDLLSFVYKASFDGALGLYEPGVLNELANALERAARRAEGWKEIKQSHRRRNFADYAFHMVHMLRDEANYGSISASIRPNEN